MKLRSSIDSHGILRCSFVNLMRLFVYFASVPFLSLRNSGSQATVAGLHRRLLDNSVTNNSSSNMNNLITHNASGPHTAASSSTNHDLGTTTTPSVMSVIGSTTLSTAEQHQCVNEVLKTLDTKLLGRLAIQEEGPATSSAGSAAAATVHKPPQPRPVVNAYI